MELKSYIFAPLCVASPFDGTHHSFPCSSVSAAIHLCYTLQLWLAVILTTHCFFISVASLQLLLALSILSQTFCFSSHIVVSLKMGSQYDTRCHITLHYVAPCHNTMQRSDRL